MKIAKLVYKNILSHGRSYAVYFLSLVFSVMVYYSFMTLSHDDYLQQLLTDNRELAGPFRLGGFFIVLFVVMFMYTTTGFFIKNRQREIGIYLLLGIRKFQVGMIFFWESLVTGLTSLVIGLVAGLIFTRLFALILLKLLVIHIDSPFLFSLTAVRQTITMFLPILLFMSLRGMYVVYRYQLIELYQGQRRGSHLKKTGLFSWLLGIIGVIMLSYGYYQGKHFAHYALALETNPQTGNGVFTAMVLILCFCVLGTYFIFKGFLPLVLMILTKSRRFYYQRMHMVTINNLHFHLKENARILGTVAVLLGTALAALGGALYFYIYSLEEIAVLAPTEWIVAESEAKYLKEAPLKQVMKLEVKVTGAYFPPTEKKLPIDGEATVVNLASVSQYQDFSPTQAPLLKASEGILLMPIQGQFMPPSPSEVYLAGLAEPIRVKTMGKDIFGGSRGVRYRLPVLVLADRTFEEIGTPLNYRVVYFDPITDGDEPSPSTYQSLKDQLPERHYYLEHHYQWRNQQVVGDLKERIQPENEEWSDAFYRRSNYFAKVPILENTRQTYGLLVYIAVFLGVVFLVATASIITVKQLAEFDQGRERYQLLLKLGVSRKKIKVSILWQTAVVFFSPLLIASLHAYFAIAALKSLLNGPNYPLIGLLMLVFLAVYALFYFYTARSCYRRVIKR